MADENERPNADETAFDDNYFGEDRTIKGPDGKLYSYKEIMAGEHLSSPKDPKGNEDENKDEEKAKEKEKSSDPQVKTEAQRLRERFEDRVLTDISLYKTTKNVKVPTKEVFSKLNEMQKEGKNVTLDMVSDVVEEVGTEILKKNEESDKDYKNKKDKDGHVPMSRSVKGVQKEEDAEPISSLDETSVMADFESYRASR